MFFYIRNAGAVIILSFATLFFNSVTALCAGWAEGRE